MWSCFRRICQYASCLSDIVPDGLPIKTTLPPGCVSSIAIPTAAELPTASITASNTGLFPHSAIYSIPLSCSAILLISADNAYPGSAHSFCPLCRRKSNHSCSDHANRISPPDRASSDCMQGNSQRLQHSCLLIRKRCGYLYQVPYRHGCKF